MRSKIHFNVNRYELSHGTTPKGRGGWLFAPYGEEENMVNFNGTFTDAVKQAREQYPDITEWVVLP